MRIPLNLMKSAFLSLLLLVSNWALADDKRDAAAGKSLFEANCQSCHALDAKLVGPKLRGVTGRRSEEWLLKWIKNNEKLRKSGDADAIAIYNEYGGAAMNPFENLSDVQILNILEYIKTAPAPVAKDNAKKPGDGGEESVQDQSSTLYVLLSLIALFFIIFFILLRIKSTLRKLVAEKYPDAVSEKPSFWKRVLPGALTKMNPAVLAMFALTFTAIVGFLWFFDFGVNEVGRQKGYAPEQPIKFAHSLHAGELAIDCKYCHSTVESSKSASIPALNTCMNCHKGVRNVAGQEGISTEIAKIYKALDYDPEKTGADQFGPNPKPVKWVRIHNLPDHAYFNHSQHVKVGKLECQECHGPVEKMEKVQQYSTLQMGWCIDCHRNKGIDVENNSYYAKLHEKVKKDVDAKKDKSKYIGADGKVKVTVAANGGLECAKCHY